jgi:putative spermidine/putrescine transport system permease protein
MSGATVTAPGEAPAIHAAAATRPRRDWLGLLLAAPITLWLLAAFAAPLATIVVLAFQPAGDMFAPLVPPDLEQFRLIFGDAYYPRQIADTLLLAAGVTVGAILLGYPVALWLVRVPPRWRPLAMSLVLIPLLTNVVVRSLGIILLLAPDGTLNQIAAALGLPRPGNMLFTRFAVGLALVQVFMPFMVLSLYDGLAGLDHRLHEAAQSLGASRVRRFFAVTLPLSLPGLRAGATIVFLMASTAYVSATLLGGRQVRVIGMDVWVEALQNLQMPLASALAVVMLVCGVAVTVALAALFKRLTPWTAMASPRGRPQGGPERALLPAWLARVLVRAGDIVGPAVGRLLFTLAVALLLFPLLLVVVQSFNDVPQATVAGFRAFTLAWYQRVLLGGAYLDSFLVSIELAAWAVACALLLALPAAFALARHPFAGRGALAAFWMLPLVLPHIAIGVGMLRLLQLYTALPPFIGLLLVHVVLILPFAVALLRTTVEQLDRALEHAAASLGAAPWRVLLSVVLPTIMPGIAVAGILAFLISFGEVTLTSFLTTARMTTLPVRIYAEATFSLEPTVHAVSTLMIAATILLLAVVNRMVRLDRVWHR